MEKNVYRKTMTVELLKVKEMMKNQKIKFRRSHQRWKLNEDSGSGRQGKIVF